MANKLAAVPVLGQQQVGEDDHSIFLFTYDIFNTETEQVESIIYLLSPFHHELTGDPIDFMRIWHTKHYSELLSDIGSHSIDLSSSTFKLDECFKIDLGVSFTGILGKLFRYPIEEEKFIWSIENFQSPY